MAVTPYLWALWQTKVGKLIISCVLIYVVVGAFIKTFKWWTIPIVIGFALIVFIGGKLDARDREKEHQRRMKELDDEYDRLQRMYEEQQRMQKRTEKRYLKEFQKQNDDRL